MANERTPTAESAERAETRPRTRRRVLATAGAALTSTVAGCGGSNGGETPTDDRTTTRRTTTRTTAGYFDTSFLGKSPSSKFAPTAGFGTVDWLGEAADVPVVKVTNLRKDGRGSLRWALNRDGTRVVVFEVGGVVDLQGEHVTVDSGNVYVAGQTAPSPGITVIRGSIAAADRNVVVQHLRVRPGDRLDDGPVNGPPDGRATDALSTDSNVPNVIFDHCSVSWGSDENMSAGGGSKNRNVTFSNSIVAEGLSRTSLHEEKEHSKGTLIMDRATDTAIVGNVYLHNTDRHPRIKGGASCAVVNNFVYNFGEAIEMGGGPEEPAVGSVVGNYFEGGPATDDPPMITAEGRGGAKAYVAYNESGNPTLQRANNQLELLQNRPLWPDGLTHVSPSKVPKHNLATAGARPADRTHHDRRLVEFARQGEGSIIDSQSEVGGYPDFDRVERELEPPASGDGLAEWLYRHAEAVELPDAAPPRS